MAQTDTGKYNAIMLRGFIFHHKESCNTEECPLKKSIKKKITSNKIKLIQQKIWQRMVKMLEIKVQHLIVYIKKKLKPNKKFYRVKRMNTNNV